ncbi:MAG: LD-carboxypeptidase [Bdellovibrionales bacterium]|nr:LD-carboxypeptidase [Bdellovibrionales bacterium]
MRAMENLIKPPRLKRGDTIAVFTPSSPAHLGIFREKYQHGLAELRRLGFKVIEGSLTASQRTQGYRTASGRDRAAELMELFLNPQVRAIFSTIGGSNSASLLPYLDFQAIRAHPKIFCGYSDVTSLHMAIGKLAGLSTLYGPAIMPTFGEFPHLLSYSENSFLRAVGMLPPEKEIAPPERWSRQIRDITSGAWKTEARTYIDNSGWMVGYPGQAEGPAVVANLNTLLTLMGTPYFPELKGKIVVLEEMEASMSQQERRWTQLRQTGVLDDIQALLVGKPEVLKTEGAPFTLNELIEDILVGLPFPRVYDFDCGHTSPMLTLAQGTPLRLDANGECARLFQLDAMVR